MKAVKFLICFFFLLTMFGRLSAQNNAAFTFVENKGQWEGDFVYKSILLNGSFFLQNQGYSVVLYNPDEIASVYGHATFKDEQNKKRTYYNTGKADDVNTANVNNDNVFHMHAFSMKFAGCNSNAKISASKPTGDLANYILGNDPNRWKTDVQSYYNVLMENIYPGVDVKYYSFGEKIKYDLILHPGSDLSRVVMEYDGLDKMSIENGKLKLETSLGAITEYVPYAYQIIDGIKKEVDCQYKLIGKNVTYVVKKYDRNALLVIDPVVILATFTGSRADNWGFTAAPGPDGSTFAGGIAFSNNFRTTKGAFQVLYRGGPQYEKGIPGVDMTITKYNPDSKKTYSTFVGGTGNETPHSIYVNNAGEAYVLGHTNSKDYPNPTNSKFGTLGNYDIFITRISADGRSVITSLIGGQFDDGLNMNDDLYPQQNSLKLFYGDNSRSELVLDENSNVYIAASAYSNSNTFPVINAVQNVNMGGQDGVLIKINSDLSTIFFSTFIGGSADDAAFSVAINPVNKKIYVSGVTQSSNMSLSGVGSFGNSFNGGIDGFVSSYNNNGTLDKTIYVGTSDVDFIYGIQFDQNGFPYITGVSFGKWPVLPSGIYNNPNAKQFISKLKPDLSGYVYSTVYGSNNDVSPRISPTAFLVDRCENVYVSGWGSAGLCPSNKPGTGTLGMPTTANAFKKTTDGIDFYFFVLAKDGASQLYGSFFGQTGGMADHVDGGTSRFDKNGVIYQAICANCYGNFACRNSMITSPLPVFSSDGTITYGNASTACNLYVLKMDFQLSGVKAGIKTEINGITNKYFGCTPLKVFFADSIAQGVTYDWDFGDGKTATGTDTISHVYLSPGNYKVTLTSKDPLRTCNPVDVNTISLIVANDKVKLLANGQRPSCLNRDFEFTNTSTSLSGLPFTNSSFIWDFGDKSPTVTAGANLVKHTFPADGTYIVTVTLNDGRFCNDKEVLTIKVFVTSKVVAQIKGPTIGCLSSKGYPFKADFESIGIGGQTFEWDFGDGSPKSSLSNPVHNYFKSGNINVTLKVTDLNACPGFQTDITTFTVSVKPSPIAGFSYLPNPPQINTPVDFTNLSVGNNLTFEWDFGDADTAMSKDPSHLFQKTSKFNVRLIAIDNYKCEDTAYSIVDAKVVPLINVANAFTPNNDGNNDKVFVRGFGIAQLSFKIFNRWGQEVFSTISPYNGWDGKFKGVLQPMDVYTYILAGVYSDGKTFSQTGDITLIR